MKKRIAGAGIFLILFAVFFSVSKNSTGEHGLEKFLFYSLGNKESQKSLRNVLTATEASPAIHQGASPNTEPAQSSTDSTDHIHVCTLLTKGQNGLSESETRKIVFAVPNKYNDNRDQDRTAEYILANIVAAGPIDPAVPVDTNDTIEFYRALVYGGLIQPNDYSQHINYKRAEQILLQLEEKHPENGAIPFFRAGALLNAGVKEESLRPVFTKAMMAPEYETYHTAIWRPVLQRSFKDAATNLLTWNLMRQSRIINQSVPFEALKILIKTGDKNFANLALTFAKRINSKNIPEKGRFDFYEWDALQYTYSEYIKYNSLKILHPEKTIPFAKKATDLMTWRSDDEFKDVFKNDKEGNPICEPEKLSWYVSRQEQYYNDYLRSQKPVN